MTTWRREKRTLLSTTSTIPCSGRIRLTNNLSRENAIGKCYLIERLAFEKESWANSLLLFGAWRGLCYQRRRNLPKTFRNSILTSNRLTGYRFDYGNGNDFESYLEVRRGVLFNGTVLISGDFRTCALVPHTT